MNNIDGLIKNIKIGITAEKELAEYIEKYYVKIYHPSTYMTYNVKNIKIGDHDIVFNINAGSYQLSSYVKHTIPINIIKDTDKIKEFVTITLNKEYLKNSEQENKLNQVNETARKLGLDLEIVISRISNQYELRTPKYYEVK